VPSASPPRRGSGSKSPGSRPFWGILLKPAEQIPAQAGFWSDPTRVPSTADPGRPPDDRSTLPGGLLSSAPAPVGLHSPADPNHPCCPNHPASLYCTSISLAGAIDPHLARRIWPARRIRDPRGYLILRITRIHHANRRKLQQMGLKSLMVHRVAVAAPRAAPFHDPEGFGTAGSTRSFVIMAEAYFRSGVR
jgi:hypothetical protein